MDHNRNYNATNCLALTIQKEHKLIVVKKVAYKTIIVSAKVLLSALSLMLLNMFI